MSEPSTPLGVPTSTATDPQTTEIGLAARAFFPNAARVTVYGDDLLRVDDADDVWKVRRWRRGTAPDRVRFVHHTLAAARAAGVEVVPDAAKLASGSGGVFVLRDRVYDAETWLPGTPLAQIAQESGPDGEHVNLPVIVRPAAWELTIQAVAALHAATSDVAIRPNAPTLPLEAVGVATRRAWEYHRQRLRPMAPRHTIIQRWMRTAERAIYVALEALDAAPELSKAIDIAGHHDLWPSHVLWIRGGRDGGGGPARLGGIIDFAEASAGSPLVDLAHLVTHFGGWTAERAETAMGIYGDVRRLSPDERRLLPAVATLDLIAQSGKLLTIAFALPEREEQAASSQLKMGATALVESLEVVTPVLLRGDAPIRAIKKRWIPRRLAPQPSGRPRPDRPPRQSGSRPTSPRRPGADR